MTVVHADTVALLPAAGTGDRLGLGPKAFLTLGGRTLLEHVVNALHELVSRTVVGVVAGDQAQARKLVGDRALVHPGGDTRQETIFRLHNLITPVDEYVLIHNVGQPFASRELISKVIVAAHESGAAASFIRPWVPVCRGSGDFVDAITPTGDVLLCFTPQAFHRDVLSDAVRYAAAHGVRAESILELVVAAGHRIRRVPGEERNIKVTTPLDWEIARKVIAPSLGWITA